jgi:hypothetical protein
MRNRAPLVRTAPCPAYGISFMLVGGLAATRTWPPTNRRVIRPEDRLGLNQGHTDGRPDFCHSDAWYRTLADPYRPCDRPVPWSSTDSLPTCVSSGCCTARRNMSECGLLEPRIHAGGFLSGGAFQVRSAVSSEPGLIATLRCRLHDQSRPLLRVLSGSGQVTADRQMPARSTLKGRACFAPSEPDRALACQVSLLLVDPMQNLTTAYATPWLTQHLRTRRACVWPHVSVAASCGPPVCHALWRPITVREYGAGSRNTAWRS